MVEYMTDSELKRRSGEEFLMAAGRFERIQALCSRVRGSMFDELWMSAHDDGAQYVEGGRVMGMRVVVTVTLLPGEIRVWSDQARRFVS